MALQDQVKRRSKVEIILEILRIHTVPQLPSWGRRRLNIPYTNYQELINWLLENGYVTKDNNPDREKSFTIIDTEKGIMAVRQYAELYALINRRNQGILAK